MINLSIIIPIYKESRNIQKLAKDITNYIDIKNYEILFIDDNSNDGTEEILKNLCEDNRNIKYIINNIFIFINIINLLVNFNYLIITNHFIIILPKNVTILNYSLRL